MMVKIDEGKAIPVLVLTEPGGLQQAEAPSIQDNRYMKEIILSVLRTGRL